LLSVQQGVKDEGFAVPMPKLCQWLGVARRTTCYKPTRSPPKVKLELAEPIKEIIEAEPPFVYCTVARLLGMNKKTVQRVFPLKGWQVRKRALGQRPRIKAKASRAETPEQRWATVLCRVWGGKDGWLSLALMIHSSMRQLLGWHPSRTGKATTASSALEQAMITRYRTLRRAHETFLLRSDNGLVFTSCDYTGLVRSYGLKQELITPTAHSRTGPWNR